MRALVPRPFVIGRSVHSREEAVAVSAAGALDFLIFGTVFESASKPGRPAAGVEALREVTTATSLPVLAVGGMTRERWPEVHAVGAAGFAAISLFA